jgi:hypothetical protein
MSEKKEKNTFLSSATVLKLSLGILLVVLGGILVSVWKWQLEVVLKGSAGIILILTGAVVMAISKDQQN